jgi:hypothetical protein
MDTARGRIAWFLVYAFDAGSELIQGKHLGMLRSMGVDLGARGVLDPIVSPLPD